MTRATKIMKTAKTCNRKAEAMLRGKFQKELNGLSWALRVSALRHWDRLIAAKYNQPCYWD